MKTIQNALDVLELVANQSHEMSPREIASRLGLNASSTVRILKTLTERGYLTQFRRRGGYSPGPVPVSLGCVENVYRELVRAANEPLQELSRKLGGTLVNLSVLQDEKRIVLYHAGYSPKNSIAAFGVKKWYFNDNATDRLLAASLDIPAREKLFQRIGIPHGFASRSELFSYLDQILAQREVRFQGEIHQIDIAGGLVLAENFPPSAIGFAIEFKIPSAAIIGGIRDCVGKIEKNLAPSPLPC